MNEHELAKKLKENYIKASNQDDDFINIIGDISEFNGLNYDKIKKECSNLNLTFMTCKEASNLATKQDIKQLYLSETQNYIYFDNSDNTKGIE